MTDLATARAAVRRQSQPLPAVSRPIDRALGCRLLETVASPEDSPPYDKAMVDGYAVCWQDVASGDAELPVIEEVFAGDVPRCTLAPGQAVRIMTGAPVPPGAEAIVMVEQTEPRDAGHRVKIAGATVKPRQHILPQGSVFAAGDELLTSGRVLSPCDVALLAEIGRASVAVIPPPRVTLIQTGDELVPVGQVRGPGQIRNSNGLLLCSLVQQAGGEVDDLGIVPDQRERLADAVRQGLQSDVLVVSGGVSMGDRDLVPGVLTGQGATCVFHRVQLRPGQPVWFGTYEREGRRTLVFGLPGNPVSCLVCFLVFVVPALRCLRGESDAEEDDAEPVELAEAFELRGKRPSFWPVTFDVGPTDRAVDSASGPRRVRALAWQGSADLRTLCAADALAFFPHGERRYERGERLTLIPLRPTRSPAVS